MAYSSGLSLGPDNFDKQVSPVAGNAVDKSEVPGSGPASVYECSPFMLLCNALCADVNPGQASAQTSFSLPTHVVNDQGRYHSLTAALDQADCVLALLTLRRLCVAFDRRITVQLPKEIPIAWRERIEWCSSHCAVGPYRSSSE